MKGKAECTYMLQIVHVRAATCYSIPKVYARTQWGWSQSGVKMEAEGGIRANQRPCEGNFFSFT
jgi:hypothetical protein